jgi:hypothetical protein
MIKNIAQFMVNNVVGWTIGENFFVGHVPIEAMDNQRLRETDKKRVVFLLENTPPDTVPQIKDRENKPIQIFNRAETYFQARADAYSFYNFLHGRSQDQLPTIAGDTWEYTSMIIDAINAPAPLENPDDKSLFYFSTNYLFLLCDKREIP